MIFSRRVATTVATLPSALLMSDFVSLGASWVFSFQPVLPPDFRPLFHLTTGVGLAIDAVAGTRLWLLIFSLPKNVLLYAAVLSTARLLLCSGSYTSPLTHK